MAVGRGLRAAAAATNAGDPRGHACAISAGGGGSGGAGGARGYSNGGSGSGGSGGSSSGSCGGSSSGSGSGTRVGGGAGDGDRGGGPHRRVPDSPPMGDHYEVLGVPRDASIAVIKAAFRQRAKELHPDVLAARARRQSHEHISYGSTVELSASAFLRIVAAYEALSNPASRREYDMRLAAAAAAAAAATSSTSSRGGGGSAGDVQPRRQTKTREARARGSGSGSGLGSDLRYVDFRSWRYGVGEWMTRTRREPVAGRTAALEYYLRKYSHEFESQLHSALVHAYLGPKLDLLPGELPRCFEADLRSHPGASDELMQLVSGRTLLGVVRIKEPLRLGPTVAMATAALPSPPAAAKPAASMPAMHGAPPGTRTAAAAAAADVTAAVAAAEAMDMAAVAAAEAADVAAAEAGGVAADVAAAAGASSAGCGGLFGAACGGPGSAAATTETERRRPSVNAEAAASPVQPTAASQAAAGNRGGGGGGDGGRGDADPHLAAHTSVPSSSAALSSIGADFATAAALAAVYGDGRGADAVGAATSLTASDGGVDPLTVLDPAAIRGLPDEAVVQLAAASIAASDAATAGYGHLVPGYSRLRGLLELQGFYPDPAVLQRRSTQISLVTAAEAAQARDAGAALGARRLMGRWRRECAAAAATAETASAAAAEGKEDSDRGGEEPEGAVAAAAEARAEAAGKDEVPYGVTPPPQLQGLAEATRLAEAEAAAAAAAVAAEEAVAATSRPAAAALNSPTNWLFGPDVSGSNGVSGGGGAADVGSETTVLEMRLGQELTAFAVHQRPPPPSPVAASASDSSYSPFNDVTSSLRRLDHERKGSGAVSKVGHGGVAAAAAAASGGTAYGATEPLSEQPEGLMVPLFGPVVEGRVKVYVDGRLEAGVEGRHVYDTAGRKVALVVRGSFPGLRTIHFFAILPQPGTAKQRLRLLCRCVQARLLPSPTWLFPPREDTHDVGGWYFEWGGYFRRQLPGWLDPSVFVFVAAIVALEQERIDASQRRAISELLAGWRDAARRAVWTGGGPWGRWRWPQWGGDTGG